MKRLTGSRGATMVEYALIGALLVVASIGAIEWLSGQSEAETEQQAECISARPPPPGCQIPSAATTTSTSIGGPPPTSATTTLPPPIPPPSETEPVDPGNVVPGPGPNTWAITGPIFTVQTGDDPPFPIQGAVIQFRFEVQDPTTGEWVVIETQPCTTGTNGQCSPPPTFTWDNTAYLANPVVNAQIVVTQINTNPAVTTLPGPFTYVLA
jgi:hypothetical protein